MVFDGREREFSIVSRLEHCASMGQKDCPGETLSDPMEIGMQTRDCGFIEGHMEARPRHRAGASGRPRHARGWARLEERLSCQTIDGAV